MNKNDCVCLCVWVSVLTSGDRNFACEWQRDRESSLFMIMKRRLIVIRIAAVVCFLVELNSFSCMTELDLNIKAFKYDINDCKIRSQISR